MTDRLEFQVDKFNIRVLTDRSYSNQGLWVKADGNLVRIGVSDYVQLRNGDVAFAEIKPVGSQVVFGAEVAVIETIKVNISLSSPVSGRVVEVNQAMETTPEVINQDPYGTGWLAVVDITGEENQLEHLLDAETYFETIKRDAEQGVKSE